MCDNAVKRELYFVKIDLCGMPFGMRYYAVGRIEMVPRTQQAEADVNEALKAALDSLADVYGQMYLAAQDELENTSRQITTKRKPETK